MSAPGKSPLRLWRGHRWAIATALIILAAWLAGMTVAMRDAVLPSDASGTVLAVFPTAMSGDEVFARITRAGGRPVRQTWFRTIWVAEGDATGFVGRLHEEGAVAAYGDLPFGPQLAGCFAWAETRVVSLFEMTP